MDNSIDLANTLTPSLADCERITDVIISAYHDIQGGRVAPKWTLDQTKEAVAAVDFQAPIGFEAALAEAETFMKNGDLLSASARCFGYFNPTAAWPAVAADILAAARNPQICVTSHAPASVTMERAVMDDVLNRLSMSGGTGHFTSGGSEANETALLCALCLANPDFIEQGLRSFARQPVFYISKDSHLAWIKIAKTVGLGTKAVRLADTNGKGEMDVDALAAMISADRAAGLAPFMIAATCGTTSAGMIDPLKACSHITKAEGIHFHVDAAWAGALIFDDKRIALLSGIELADSVTIDAHKWLSVPMGAGMIALRESKYAANVFSVQTSYMPEGDGADLYITTNQWSRRFIGLRLWMMLRTMGPQGYAAIYDRHFAIISYLKEQLIKHGWAVRNESALPVLVFDDLEGAASQLIADAVEKRGRAWLGRVQFEGRSVLRACTTSFLTARADVDVLISELGIARSSLK